MVLICHFAQRFSPYSFEKLSLSTTNLGSGGVSIFFVISGFIMWMTSESTAVGDFLERRITRIVPLYWLCTLVMAARLYETQGVVSVPDLVKSLLFWAYALPNAQVLPLVPPGWSLNVEMFFYALFAVALLVAADYRLRLLTALLVACTIGGLFVTSAHPPELVLMTRPYLLEFVSGLWIAEVALRHRPHLSRTACAFLVVGGFAALLIGSGHNSDSWLYWVQLIVPSTSIVLGAVMYELQYSIGYWRWLVLLGNASYAIYLTHWFLLKIGTSELLQNPVLKPIVTLSVCLAAGIATYLLVEKPLLEAIRNRGTPKLNTSTEVL